MRIVLMLICCKYLAVSALCQTFFPVGDNVLAYKLMPGLANECIIPFNNPSGDTLLLKWRNLEISKPEFWVMDLCDYGACYVGVPESGTMNPVYESIQPYLKLIVQPTATEGSAWLWFRVEEKDNPANRQDVYFSLYTPDFTNEETPVEHPVKFYPNPATDFLVLESNAKTASPLKIYDASGRLFAQFELRNGKQILDIASLPSGLAFLVTANQTCTFFKH
jgi:Secretion system C-terminal sorting domain